MRLMYRILLSVLSMSLAVVLLVELMPTRWLASLIEARASAQLGVPVRIGTLSVDLVSLTPGMQFRDTRIATHPVEPALQLDEARIAVSLPALLGGELVIDDVLVAGGRVFMQTDAEGRSNWDQLFVPFDKGAQRSIDALILPVFNRIRLRDIAIRYRDVTRGQQAELALHVSGSTAYPADPSAFRLSGRINGVPTRLAGAVGSFSVWPPARLDLDVAGALGSNRLAVEGTIGRLGEGGDFELDVDVDVQALSAVADVLGAPLPSLPGFTFSGQLVANEAELVLRDVAGRMGQSDVEGDLRVDLTTRPASVIANLLSRELHLAELAELVRSLYPSRFDEEFAAGAADEWRALSVLWSAPWPQSLQQFATVVTGWIDYHAVTVRGSSLPVTNYAMHVELDSGGASLRASEFTLAEGSIALDIAVDFSTPELMTEVVARLEHLRLESWIDSTVAGDSATGRLGGFARVVLEHDPHDARSRRTDGDMNVLLSAPNTHALLETLAGQTLLASVGSLQPQSVAGEGPGCVYLDLGWLNGRTTLERALIDTPDTVFVLDGVVEGRGAAMDISIVPLHKRPAPRRAAAPIRVSGSLDQPLASVSRAAVSSSRWQNSLIASDAAIAALMPYVRQRPGGRGSDPCLAMPLSARQAQRASRTRE